MIPNFSKYVELNAWQVKHLPDGELDTAVFGYVFCNYDSTNTILNWLLMPKKLRHCFYSHQFECERCNGGLYQVIMNKSILEIEMARQGFEAIGAHDVASLLADLKRASGIWSPYRWLVSGAHRALPKISDEEFDELEKRHKGVPLGVPEKRAMYIRENAEEIWPG